MKARDPETRAAVMAALLTGQSIDSVAREYNVPEGTVKYWKHQGLNDKTPKKEVGELLLEYLRANLETLRAQVEVFRDPAWLRRNSASDVAVLHGVMTDKAIRLLEALSKSDAAANQPPED